MLTSLASLALLYLAALIIPGPNLLLLTHTAASSSRKAALGVALGIATGTFMWVAVAVFGVQRIFDAAPTLQTGLRVAGGLYLIYLAYGLLRSLWIDRNAAPRATDATETNDKSSVETPGGADDRQSAYFRRGLLTNLTNPKSLAFWTSVAVVSLDPNAMAIYPPRRCFDGGRDGPGVAHRPRVSVFDTTRATRLHARQTHSFVSHWCCDGRIRYAPVVGITRLAP